MAPNAGNTAGPMHCEIVISSPLSFPSSVTRLTHHSHERHDMMQGERRIQSLHLSSHITRHSFQVLLIHEILRRGHRESAFYSISNALPQCPLRHPDGPGGQISDPVLETFLVVANDEFIVIIGIASQGALIDEEEAHGIVTEPVNSKKWVYYIPRRFGHFFPVHRPVAMDKQVAGQWKVKRHQECGPVDTVETDI